MVEPSSPSDLTQPLVQIYWSLPSMWTYSTQPSTHTDKF